MNKNSVIWLTEPDLDRLRHLIADLTRRSRGMQSDVEMLEEILDSEHVVAREDIPHNVVTMNSTAVFQDLQSSEQQTVTVVYPEDIDPAQGKISVLSPVGVDVLGLSEGDEAELPIPYGQTRRIRISEVLYQPEARGHYAL